jgi:hypothetical protein
MSVDYSLVGYVYRINKWLTNKSKNTFYNVVKFS